MQYVSMFFGPEYAESVLCGCYWSVISRKFARCAVPSVAGSRGRAASYSHNGYGRSKSAAVEKYSGDSLSHT